MSWPENIMCREIRYLKGISRVERKGHGWFVAGKKLLRGQSKFHWYCFYSMSILLSKDVIYKSIVKRLPETIKVDLWFHQYNEKLFNAIVANSVGRYTQYLIMNYKNDEFSQVLEKVDPKEVIIARFPENLTRKGIPTSAKTLMKVYMRLLLASTMIWKNTKSWYL